MHVPHTPEGVWERFRIICATSSPVLTVWVVSMQNTSPSSSRSTFIRIKCFDAKRTDHRVGDGAHRVLEPVRIYDLALERAAVRLVRTPSEVDDMTGGA